MDPARDFGRFLQTIFQFKVQKISINAGFTCPNRDGTKGIGGCTYCDNRAFSPQYAAAHKTVAQQLEEGIRFFARKYPAMRYLAYFQSYTNTYGQTDQLLEKYAEALSCKGVEGLIISTRPDCMANDLLIELQKLSQRYFLLVEYGVESTCNETLNLVNRRHSWEDSIDAIRRTAERGIRCGTHLILGLPGESRATMLAHADRISDLPLTTVKLHQLQILRGTAMEQLYCEQPDLFHLFTVDEYIDLCHDFVGRLNPDFYLDRLTAQSPANMLAVGGWGLKNHEFTAKWKTKINTTELS
jgi:radical SAM protein (TIGR01212 family)